jgi:hypothetical protein
MLRSSSKPAPGQASPDPVKQSRVLKRLFRDLVAFTGCAAAELASKPRKVRQPKRRRVLYGRGDLSDADLLQLINEIGAERILKALDALTQPQLFAA